MAAHRPTATSPPLLLPLYCRYRAEAERAAIEGGAEEEARLLEQARPKERRAKEEPGGFVDGDEEPEEETAAAAADGDEEEDDEDGDGDELGYLHETTTQGGLAGALEMARGRGMLGADGPTSGRMFDQKGRGCTTMRTATATARARPGTMDAPRTQGARRTTPRFSHTPHPPPSAASSSTISTSTAAR